MPLQESQIAVLRDLPSRQWGHQDSQSRLPWHTHRCSHVPSQLFWITSLRPRFPHASQHIRRYALPKSWTEMRITLDRIFTGKLYHQRNSTLT